MHRTSVQRFSGSMHVWIPQRSNGTNPASAKCSSVVAASRMPNEDPPEKTLLTMNWRIEVRPEVEWDVAEAAAWYEERQPGLGADFFEEVLRVWDALTDHPLLGSQRPSDQEHSLANDGALSLSGDL